MHLWKRRHFDREAPFYLEGAAHGRCQLVSDVSLFGLKRRFSAPTSFLYKALNTSPSLGKPGSSGEITASLAASSMPAPWAWASPPPAYPAG